MIQAGMKQRQERGWQSLLAVVLLYSRLSGNSKSSFDLGLLGYSSSSSPQWLGCKSWLLLVPCLFEYIHHHQLKIGNLSLTTKSLPHTQWHQLDQSTKATHPLKGATLWLRKRHPNQTATTIVASQNHPTPASNQRQDNTTITNDCPHPTCDPSQNYSI